jgi:hypothetical protein
MRPTTRVRGWMRQEALWVIVLAAIASNISILMQIAGLASVIPD